MHIYIPSRGRAHQIGTDSTLLRLPPDHRARTTIVTHESEHQLYLDAVREAFPDSGVGVWSAGDYENIAVKRHRIGQHVARMEQPSFLMMDDDVDFLIRKGDDVWNLRACTDEEVGELMDFIAEQLIFYAQVGVSAREGQNRWGVGPRRTLVALNTRLMRIVGYQTEAFLSVEHNRVPVMEDMDVNLQLLRQGRDNLLICYWANGQRMTNAPGGCSIWRTLEVHNAAAERLAELHPGFVTTRLKTNKTDADGLGTRTEVTVQWKRARG